MKTKKISMLVAAGVIANKGMEKISVNSRTEWLSKTNNLYKKYTLKDPVTRQNKSLLVHSKNYEITNN